MLITVDCGINAFAPIEAINAAGIDVIVIDHHEPEGTKLPQALAVIDPKRWIVFIHLRIYLRLGWWQN